MAHPSHLVSSPAKDKPKLKQRGPRRAIRVTGVVMLATLGIAVASTAANSFLELHEKSSITPYGDLVDVGGGSMNVYRAGTEGAQPLVLLSGLGTTAPALDFAPLIRELSSYDVIVVEGFGYGYSDMSAPERTVRNISAELHQALSSLDIGRPYVLAGHSIAGFYTLDYANRYPGEVSAVVGIDPSVPAVPINADTDSADSGAGINITKILSTIGLVRAALWVAPSLADPPGEDFTPAELERMRQMTTWNFGNAAVADETARIGSNAVALNGVTYPENLPVLGILASDSIAADPKWRETHENQLRNVRRHEIVELEGPHSLHWTQSKAMAQEITEFLQASAISPGPATPPAAPTEAAPAEATRGN
ncbi:alpha/beta hydrolase [Arthrobacter sp. MSA 4-2]|uniref:alpha/beta fold hydrolase n=1 Tax=Arthrobacter sp. MSA 4-2 TaxID=2794349 RepID=UPI0018E8F683|nr:alpha/beta hydrolase [Arthrobacter sp. MSA 4-2]MBJ2121667.1 alpha/beta hydrolase [Arthrobacter sp. MSA 4-2]